MYITDVWAIYYLAECSKECKCNLTIVKHPVSECYGIGDENEMSKTVSFNRPHNVCTK